ncbi:hypothetical protein JI62_10375 [Halomonas campaniensis]|uniref:Uncharacterized protein n=1 Tax=Halomonas campaniensis TaxID=213554 RepID=A0A246S1J5_9GAMM|nr:hypothetical protein JI62_10375 [Halomonas campaniensis]
MLIKCGRMQTLRAAYNFKRLNASFFPGCTVRRYGVSETDGSAEGMEITALVAIKFLIFQMIRLLLLIR